MSNGNFSQCTICHRPFNEKSDIVVCPECGAPSHRDCYKEHGTCAVCQGEGGVTYTDPIQSLKQQAASEKDGISTQLITCKECGSLNHPENDFCNNCGAPLEKRQAQDPFVVFSSGGNTADAIGPEDPSMLMGGYKESDTIDQVPAKDMAAYIGPNAGYYLMHFHLFSKRNRKASFSFSAFFAPPVYYFYRKMWVTGLFLAAIFFILNLPTTYTTLQQMGIQVPAFAFIENTILATQPTLVLIIQLALMSLSGIYANYLYMQKVLKSVKKVKEEFPVNYREVLAKKGGVSQIVFIIFLMALFALLIF